MQLVSPPLIASLAGSDSESGVVLEPMSGPYPAHVRSMSGPCPVHVQKLEPMSGPHVRARLGVFKTRVGQATRGDRSRSQGRRPHHKHRTWALLEPMSGLPRPCWDSDMAGLLWKRTQGPFRALRHSGTWANTGPDMGTEVPMSGGPLRPSGPLTGLPFLGADCHWVVMWRVE